MITSYSTLGLIVGSVFLAAGFFCMLGRSSGITELQLELWQLKLRVKSSLPGVIFAVLGLLVVFVTRPR